MAAEHPSVHEFESHRARLLSLAYRMLGSAVEAEDVVQDTYLRWHAAEKEAVDNPAAWLTTVLMNACRTRLTSARARREVYVGPWLPEPVLTGPVVSGVLDPQETAERRESVSLGFLALLERLTPSERAVFVLREAFGHTHQEIASILGGTEASSRQLLRRARERLAGDRRRFAPSDQDSRDIVALFLDAANGGSLSAFEKRLADDVVATSDGGGQVTAGRRPVVGADRVTRFLAGFIRLAETRGYAVTTAPFADALALTFSPEGRSVAVATAAEINGAHGLLTLADGAALLVQQFTFLDGEVTHVLNVANPEKLAYVSRQLRELTPS
ncbi:RNA polymerase sigma factor SigJ [Spiractinospora alimapuensis]|uniref:RNA polymerase sigma factor SigJ n=1 Tax=Spiractinospora alimapuensis TaxID=2820884 RepID=UPI001F4146D8|nr:RNA polymerase sigma factor SigJ [Spiractinospora alimapuensis]QVQ52664.1 RNA polymerase sigma factor SigJ [Spiractinospora alimapuensis]